MSKRAYVEIASDSDDESRHSAQSSSKRLRRGTNGEGPHAQSGRNKGKGKARAVNATVEIDEEQDDENDSEDDIVIPEIEPHVEQDLDQEEFERQNGELVQTQLENKRKDQIPGVSHSARYNFLPISIIMLAVEYRGAWDHRVHRDAPIYVPQVPQVQLRTSDKLYNRFVALKNFQLFALAHCI